MIIIRAKYLGFCEGVKMAIEKTNKALRESKKKIFVMGPLIHNRQVIKKLSKEGLKIIEDLNELNKDGILIVRTHGLPEPKIKKAIAMGVNIVDATCYKVKSLHKLAKQLVKEGYQLVLIGDHDHAEVGAIKESIKDNVVVISSPDEVEKNKLSRKIGIVVQTTQREENFSKIVNKILEKVEELKVFNTICKASILRQNAAYELSKNVDLMIVIGGRDSANTNRLAEICQGNAETYHIETKDELKKSWFRGKKKIGITAGASTPNWIIEKVEKEIERICTKSK
ncbi:MAG: 4-hydroxy-3-methylbut-2-enyl diphosphate reductase [Candidatus Schekmanbacteria bacterium RBG_16_38_11]|uniref:4-hydroxy-3-methylbut-2-enyl diphosphate reductase n=1 Tax=Candidatus Schekmanbacteria bacterium RBG_16_38_11 TaxID=1817880 RepID=A0A1F7S304_9BACT|nr:MAG: 4-hydroxy-3-methylbut-2-enyl diphosphate reductase [Candidatus Schekmanbacteria bacterium RBG_16_38_11]